MSSIQLPLRLGLPGGATLSNFVDGPNGPARHWVERVVRSRDLEALYLWGPCGCGKTHLLQAAGRAVAQGGGEVAYIPLGHHDRLDPSILVGLEGLELVCFDDVDAVAGQGQWEEALFHLLNRLRHAGRCWLASARGAPGALRMQLPDLESRLAAALTARLAVLSESERVEALRRRAKDRGFRLPDQVSRFLLRRFPRDLHTLFAILDDLDEASLRQGRRVTLALARTLVGGEANRLAGAPEARTARHAHSPEEGA